MMVEFQELGATVVDYGNNLRTEAKTAGFERAFDYPGFVPAYVRPLFCRGIGPFRWAALSGDPDDIAATDAAMRELFPGQRQAAALAGRRRAADRVPGPAGAHLLDRLRRPPPRRPAVQRARALAARSRRRS